MTSNKFAKAEVLLNTISIASEAAEVASKSALTISSGGTGAITGLFPYSYLTESEARAVDKKLELIVAEVLKDKVETAIVQLEELGINVEPSIVAELTQDPEEQL